ncbi:hypothetical protein [Mycobacterium celatum]|nr:hypothetical protein [Mycobacterium celatum]
MTVSHTNRNEHLTFRANMGIGRHGWLRLTPAYSMQLVRDRVAHLPKGAVVTDPFSGTGTTPLAAAEHGLLGQSIDINPFLIWLGRTKTAHYSDANVGEAPSYVKKVVRGAYKLLNETELWQPNLFKIERWWDSSTLRALKAIRQAIDSAGGNPQLSDLMNIALCRTLISSSNAAFNHQSMSFKPTDDALSLIDIDKAALTINLFEREAKDVTSTAAFDLLGSATIKSGDSRHEFDGLEPCDLLLTSPPYVNRMSYIRELRPYMYWLRFLDIASDAGELDWKAIGGTWGTATSNLNTWRPSETGTPVDEEMDSVRELIARDGGKNGPLLSNYVGKYFHDMWEHFQAAYKHVKPGGSVSYIVGNSTFYGHLVPAERWYGNMLREAGFDKIEITTIRKRNSNKRLYEFDVEAVRP